MSIRGILVSKTTDLAGPYATMPGGVPGGCPANVKTAAQRALYNNLDKNEGLALALDAAIQDSRQDGWKDSSIKMKRVRNAIKAVLEVALARSFHRVVPVPTPSTVRQTGFLNWQSISMSTETKIMTVSGIKIEI